MHKEKILAQLAEKFPGVSKRFLGFLAEKLSAEITEESQIEGAISKLETSPIPISDLATQFQKEGDERVEAAKKKWTNNPPKTDKTTTPTDDTPPADEPPKWAKDMMQELQTLKTEKAQATIKGRIEQHEKLKGIPPVFYNKRALPESEEAVEGFVADAAADWSAFEQQQANEKGKKQSPIVTGGGGDAGQPSEAMKAHLEKRKQQREAQAETIK
jgi:hypothetical protein